MAIPETLIEPIDPKDPLLRKPAVWKLLVIALFAEIAYAMLNISTMPVYLQYDRGFGASIIGVIIAAFLLSEAVFKGPMGALADKFGRRWPIILGPAISVFTSLATIFLPKGIGFAETGGILLLRALDGIGAAMLWPAAFALVGDSVEDSKRQHAMSLLNMCYLVGIALALPIGGAANDLAGAAFKNWTGARSPALFLSAAMFALVVVVAVTQLPRKEPDHSVNEDGHSVSIWAVLGSLKSIPGYLLLALVTFMGVGFPMAIIKLFSEDELKLSESQFGLVALPVAILMAALSVPLSKLGERMGRAKAVHVGLGMCAIGMSLIASGAILPFMRSLFVIGIGVIPVGLGFLMTIPAWMASVSDLDCKRRAVNIGAVMTAQGVGAILGMPLGSMLYERLQPLGEAIGYGPSLGRYAPFVGCAACIGIGWLLSMKLLKEPVAPTIQENEGQVESADISSSEAAIPPSESQSGSVPNSLDAPFTEEAPSNPSIRGE